MKGQTILKNSFIESYDKQLRNLLVIEKENLKFDKYINEIHFKNGKYLIDKGIFVKRKCGVDYITNYINYDYEEPTEQSLKYIDDILNQIYGNEEDKKCMLEYFGSALTGQSQNDARMLFMVGAGSSGKSTVCKFSEHALECYAYQMDCDIFNEKNSGINKILNTFDIRPVLRMVFIPEIKKDITESSLFKQLIEGTANATKLYQEGDFIINHQARLYASTNDLPKIKADDTGMARRYTAYPHKSKFCLDDELNLVDPSKRMYKANKKLDGIFKNSIPLKLAWFKILAIAGKRWLDNNMEIVAPNSFKELKTEIQDGNDPSKDFIDGFIIKTDDVDDIIGKDKMMAVYKKLYPNKFLNSRQLISVLTRSDMKNKLIYEKDRRGECGVRGVFVGVKINNNNVNKFLKNNNNTNDKDEGSYFDEEEMIEKKEYDVLDNLYEERDKECDELKKRIIEIEIQLSMANKMILLLAKQGVNEKIGNEKIVETLKFIQKLDKEFKKVKENVNEIDMRVASIENDQMINEFDDEESDDIKTDDACCDEEEICDEESKEIDKTCVFISEDEDEDEKEEIEPKITLEKKVYFNKDKMKMEKKKVAKVTDKKGDTETYDVEEDKEIKKGFSIFDMMEK